MRRSSVFPAFGLFCAAAVFCRPCSVSAAGAINVAWNDCILGSASAANRNSPCNSNTGAAAFYTSFRPPLANDQFLGADATLDVVTDSSVLPDWWRLETGACRAGKISQCPCFTGGPFSCVNVWQGQASAGLYCEYGAGPANDE